MVGEKRGYNKEYSRAYYLEHQEEIKDKSSKYYHKNKNNKNGGCFAVYVENKGSKKFKKNMERIRKIDEKIERLKNE